jgi:hypothetical protein
LGSEEFPLELAEANGKARAARERRPVSCMTGQGGESMDYDKAHLTSGMSSVQEELASTLAIEEKVRRERAKGGSQTLEKGDDPIYYTHEQGRP